MNGNSFVEEMIDVMPPIEIGLYFEFHIQIPINPYKGYQEVLSSMPECVALVGCHYIPSIPSDASGEGYMQYSFISKCKGSGTILFDHIKPWEPHFGKRTILEKRLVIVR